MPPLFRHRHRLLSGAVAIPVITSVTPNAGAVGDPITITGTNFGAARGIGSVVFTNTAASFSNSVTVPNILSWSDTQIVVKVPNGVTFPYVGSFIRVTTNTAQGASSAATFLWTGGAAAFAGGSSQFMGIADNVALSMGAGVRLTIVGWIFPTSFAANAIPVGKWNGTAATTEYGVQVNTAGLWQFRVSDGATIRNSNGVTLTLNAWNFAMAQWDGTNLVTSLNGGAFTAGIAGADIQDGALAFRLGLAANGTSPFTGNLDGVGLWKRALTAGEITTLYNAGQGLNYASALALGGGLLTNLAGWFDLDDAGGSGATWVDRLGVSNLTAGTGTAAPTSVRGVR